MQRQAGTFRPSYGTHKFGDDYWPGARPDPDEVVDRLIDGTSVSVFGLRRIGKSSLIAEARERLRARGVKVLWIDLQKHDTLAGTLAAILKELAQNGGPVARIGKWAEATKILPPDIKARIGTIISSKIDAVADSSIDDYAEALFEQIGSELAALRPADRPVMIFDELPLLFLNAIKKAPPDEVPQVVARLNKFLAILRHWRSDDVGIAMVLCGSFSMPWLRRQYGIDDEHINDCDPVDIEEMTDADARGLIEACIAARRPRRWEDGCTDALMKMIPANYPGVIQLAYSKIKFAEDASLSALRGPLRDKIEDAFEDRYYIQFDRRFARYSEDERARANRLFKAIAAAPGGRIDFDRAAAMLSATGSPEDDQDGRELLDLLHSDGFLTPSRSRGVAYSSGLVSAWRSD